MAGRSYRWSQLQELIFLDRYAKKGSRESIAAGDTVVVMTSDDPRHPAKEVGVVRAVDGDRVTVELKHTGEVIRQHKSRCDKPLELGPEQMWDRMARAIVSVEAEAERQRLEPEFRWLLEGWRFVPGGRINAMLGTGQNLTAYNCYVIPLRANEAGVPADSRNGIIDTLGNMVEIMSRGGGVGINLSTLRPRLAYVKGVNGKSSGSVSWGGLFSFATGLVEQGGSRRGALMLILNVWHPDILEFINAKRDFRAITNANISVGITADFERTLDEDGDWELVFPDTSDPDYDRLWDGDLRKWKEQGKPVVVYQRLKAREIWRQLVESAWASAEPGIVRLDYANEMSNSWYFAPLVSTNPCGEQPLPPWGVCLLGHINLARFVRDGEVLWDELGRAARLGVRFLDNVIDVTPYFFPENEKQQKRERRVGMGTMGLGEMLIHLGLRYGSPESLEFIDKLYRFIALEAYQASIDLAKEKGAFPAFNPDLHVKSGFMKQMPEEIRKAVKTHGIRNVTLLTQAPTGTVGTMVGTSTGIEPYYAWTYWRQGRLGRKEVVEPIVQEWFEAHPEVQPEIENLPAYFVTALELTPEEHVRVQAAVQRWVDSSISKTANLPAHYTVEQTLELYDLARRLGCKGITVYRDRSRNEQVLTRKEEGPSVPAQAQVASAHSGHGEAAAGSEGGSEAAEAAEGAQQAEEPRRPQAAPPLRNGRPVHAVIGQVPDEVIGLTYRQTTMVGTARIVINETVDGQPFETIVVLGKGGMDVTADAEALGRLISLYLRTPSEIDNRKKLSLVVDQLRGIGGATPVGFGPNKVLSLPDALAKALDRYLKRGRPAMEGVPAEVQADELEGVGLSPVLASADAPDGVVAPSAKGAGRGAGAGVAGDTVGTASVAGAAGASGAGASAHPGSEAGRGVAAAGEGDPSGSAHGHTAVGTEVRQRGLFNPDEEIPVRWAPSVATDLSLDAFADLCPSCGQFQYVRSEGCGHCLNCGYSTC